jgi:effector-binding domain-containing protein
MFDMGRSDCIEVRDYRTAGDIDLRGLLSNHRRMKPDLRWLVGGAGLLLFIGLLLPDTTRVRRDIAFEAHRATVFVLIANPRRMMQWSPLTEFDPNLRLGYSGPARGVGATVSWQGRIIGEGRQTIVESEPFERIVLRIDSSEGLVTKSTFELADEEGGTRVSWTWERTHGLNLAARLLGLLEDGNRGPVQERGLARLAAEARSLPRADFSDLDVQETVVDAVDIAYIRTRSAARAEEISNAMSDAFFDLAGFVDRHGLAEAGPPMSITRRSSGSDLVFDAAIPIRGLTDEVPRTENAVEIGRTYAGPAIRVRHTGSYTTLGRTHDKIAAYLAATGIARNGDAWESYVSDPGRTDESGLTTYIYYPVRN